MVGPMRRAEASHAVSSIALNVHVEGAEIQPDNTGTVWHQADRPTHEEHYKQVVEKASAVPEMKRVFGQLSSATISRTRDRAIIYVAGPIGEENALGTEYSEKKGTSDMIMAEACCELISYSAVGARSYLDYIADETRAILREHWRAVIAVAVALHEKMVLTGDEI